MEQNDDRIAELVGGTFKAGFFGDITADTEAKARELVGTLAENHVIFRALQGRNIVSTSRDQPKTLGDYLGKMMQASPVLPLIATDETKPEPIKAAPKVAPAPAPAAEQVEG